MIAKKTLQILLDSQKRENLRKQAFLFIKNIVRYQNFSFNLNSKRYWNEKLSKFDDFWRKDHYEHIIDLFPKDKEFSLLDIGCAMGDGCELLQKRFPKAKITGIDISDVGIEKAKKKNKEVEYFILDIIKQPLLKKYEYITIIETLEHFNEPFTTIDKCLKHVKEAIIVSTPYHHGLSGKRSWLGEHKYYFNEKTFAKYNSRVIKIVTMSSDEDGQFIIFEVRP